MQRTVANLICDFHAPEQPEDCRQASLELLIKTLLVTGPVIHEGQIVTVAPDEDGHEVTFDLSRALAEFPCESASPQPRPHQIVSTDSIPPDEELAEAWGIPTASSLAFPLTAKES